MFQSVEELAQKQLETFERNMRQRLEEAARTTKLSYIATVRALTADGATPATTNQSVSVTELTSGATILRIPAGGNATLTVTGLAGWHYDSAALTLTGYGANMALPVTLSRTLPGPTGFDAVQTFVPKQPIFVGSLIYAYDAAGRVGGSVSSADKLVLEVDGTEIDPPWPMSLAQGGQIFWFQNKHVGGHLSKLTLRQQDAHAALPWITAILPNVAEGLSVAQEDDRALHSVPRALRGGEAAQTGDLSAYLNAAAEAGAESALLRISARTDCCIAVQATLSRRRRASGVTTGAAPESLTLSPFAPVSLSPALPTGDGVHTTLTATATASGPAQLGVATEADPATWQTIALAPRVALMQPFTLPSLSTAKPHKLTGLWLALTQPPDSAETLHLDLCPFDAETKTPGPALLSAQTEISPRQMDLIPLQPGLFIRWVQFDKLLEIDPPDAAKTFALVLRDLSGSVPLLEVPAPLSGPLLPAFWRNAARSDRWQMRSFGAAQKVLLFEIGVELETATLTVQAGTERHSVPISGPRSKLHLTFPAAATLELTSDRALELSDVTLSSATAPQNS